MKPEDEYTPTEDEIQAAVDAAELEDTFYAMWQEATEATQ
jgi:hypothetical protein